MGGLLLQSLSLQAGACPWGGLLQLSASPGAKARLPPLGRMFWESFFEKVSPITWALSSRHQAVHVDERDVHSPKLHRESSPCVRILAAARLFLLPGHRGGGVETYAETEESAGCEPLQATGGLPQGQVSGQT